MPAERYTLDENTGKRPHIAIIYDPADQERRSLRNLLISANTRGIAVVLAVGGKLMGKPYERGILL